MKNMKNHLLKLAAAVVVALPLAASADKTEIPAAGTWIDCNIAPQVRTAGLNTFVTIGIKEIFYGAMEGTFECTEYDVVRSDGTGTFRGAGIFTGTLFAGTANERFGTAIFRYRGEFGPEGALAKWSLVGLTGSLASAKGDGTFDVYYVEAGDEDDLFCEECDGGVFAGNYEGTFKLGK